MNVLKRLFLVLLLLTTFNGWAQDPIVDVLKQEIKKEYGELKNTSQAPYYMNFRIDQNLSYSVSANMGSLASNNRSENAYFMSQIRLGDYQIDSYLGDQSGRLGSSIPPAKLPIEVDKCVPALKEAIWRDVNSRYKLASEYFESAVKANYQTIEKQQDKAPNFSAASPNISYEAPLTAEQTKFDDKKWEKRVCEYSALLLDNKNITESSSSISFSNVRKYFVSTDGDEVVHNLQYCHLFISLSIMAEDGMQLPLYKQYFAFTPEGLPSNEQVIKDIKELGVTLIALREAPMVDSYTGPALLTGAASGVFFHEIFGHRIESQPMKSNSDGRTFTNLLGKPVLPTTMSVYDDPSLEYYQGAPLNGYYKYDEQGAKGERVNVVDNGILKDFLRTRTPIEVMTGPTNGHARAQMGLDPTSRQSNLVVATEEKLTEADLRKLLLDEIKNQNKTYGFLFTKVTGGFTATSASNVNSFQVTPLEVYRVYLDGRPDEIVRGVALIGTPLSMFSNISHAGGEHEIFTGMCGASSGQVPVTAISPMIFVDKIEVQRQPASTTQKPILERP